jgi:hypothetical protein
MVVIKEIPPAFLAALEGRHVAPDGAVKGLLGVLSTHMTLRRSEEQHLHLPKAPKTSIVRNITNHLQPHFFHTDYPPELVKYFPIQFLAIFKLTTPCGFRKVYTLNM